MTRPRQLTLPLGAVTAAALKAENYFKHIRVFERRETAGGTWYGQMTKLTCGLLLIVHSGFTMKGLLQVHLYVLELYQLRQIRR